jgi:hypothetical protein
MASSKAKAKIARPRLLRFVRERGYSAACFENLEDEKDL